MASLLEEARALSDAGVKELIVIAQDITKYGMDLPEHKRLLPELLRELCKLDFTWIRLHYLYPDQITDELIDVIAEEPKIVKYLDIPLQHVSKRILRAMHRPGDGAEFTALIEDMRRRIPGLVLRTSLIVGLPALRLKGDYLAIVTLGCGEIIKSIVTNLNVTGGAKGLNTGAIYADTKTLLPYGIVLVFLVVIVMMNLKNSRHGRAIMAIRDNRIAAESNGVNVTYYKLMVFIIAAFFAGMAGVLYGHTLANIKPAMFDYNMSIEILVIVVLGGMGSIRGSIIATIILRALPEALREVADYRMLAYSVLLIVIMLLNASPKFAELKGRWSVGNILRMRKANKEKEGKENG